MANKIMVTSSQITTTVDSQAKVFKQTIPDFTYDMSQLTVNASYYSDSIKRGSGLISAKLFDKDDQLIKELSFIGKLGAPNPLAVDPETGKPLYLLSAMSLAVAASDTDMVINPEGGSEYTSILYKHGVSPTQFSTGRLVVSISGGVAEQSRAHANMQAIYRNFIGDPVPVMCGIEGGLNSKAAGHLEIEIEFNVVSV